jgi:hypothetical protein
MAIAHAAYPAVEVNRTETWILGAAILAIIVSMLYGGSPTDTVVFADANFAA